MPIIRNPFRKNPGDQILEDGARPMPTSPAEAGKPSGQRPSPLQLRPNGDKQPTEYKLSGMTISQSSTLTRDEGNNQGAMSYADALQM